MANYVTEGDVVAHLADKPLVLDQQAPLPLDFHGDKGRFILVDGNMSLNVADYFYTDGNMAAEFKSMPLETATVAGESISEVMDVLTIGASDLDAFAGAFGPKDSSDAVGLALSNVNLGLALMKPKTRDTYYISLKANVGDASFIGIDDVTLSASNLSVLINQSNSTDVANLAEKPIAVNAGVENEIALDFNSNDGKLLRAKGDLTIDIGGYAFLDGNIAYETKTQDIELSDKEIVKTEIMNFTSGDLSLFVGTNGPGDQEGAVGFNVSNTNLALMLMKPTDTEDNRSWTVLKAHSDQVGFVGIDDITMNAENISVSINQADGTDVVANLGDEPFEMPTGPDSSVLYDIDSAKGEFVEISGEFNVSVNNFFQLEGQIAFEQYSREFTLADQTTVQTNLFTTGASAMDVFAGIGPKDSDNALGFVVDKADFGLAIITPKDESDSRSWTALKASADQAAFLGSDQIEINAEQIDVNLNLVQNDENNVIDFASDPLEMTLGPDTFTTLDYDGAEGNIMSIAAFASINLF
jgi:hypothetical protein